MNKHKIAVWFVNLVFAFGLAAISLPAQAAVPQTLNYQGQLSNAAGAPVNATVSMTFKLYDVETGGTALWSETQSVTVSKGLYSVRLGQVTPLASSLFGAGLYLGITVETDAEMTPRIALSSAPYAMQSSCTPGDQMDCYTGASATRNVGACKSGKRNCTSTGWNSACDGEVLPVAEVVNGIDDDCNGVVNNGVGCFIGGASYANGAANPVDACQVCNMALTTTAWSNSNSGVACNDGDACTTGDACDGFGTCVSGATVNVDDGIACTTDACDQSLGSITHTANNDMVDDGNACTTDICDPVVGAIHTQVANGTLCGTAANATLACNSGNCTALSCSPMFANCDYNEANGCEANLASSAQSCGTCGTVCPANTPCMQGVCVATCSDGLKNGSETDIDCGGAACGNCSAGKHCTTNSDCVSNICSGGLCQ